MWDPKGYPVTVRRIGPDPNYRPILKKVKDSGEENIIIDCSIDILAEVLKQSLQVGILSDKHRVIVTNMVNHLFEKLTTFFKKKNICKVQFFISKWYYYNFVYITILFTLFV